MDLVDILDIQQYKIYELLAKEAEVVFAFAMAAVEEKATMAVVLKKTDQSNH